MRLKINTSTREILRADYITGVMTEEYVDVDGGEVMITELLTSDLFTCKMRRINWRAMR